MKIIERNGDVLQSSADLVCHQVNCAGVMGSGLAKQIKNQYPHVYEEYTHLVNECKKCNEDLLGHVQYCYLNGDGDIANIFGQRYYGRDKRYTDYDALMVAWDNVANYMKECNLKTIAIPKNFGCGLGGGDWNTVLNIIINSLKDLDVTLYIYEWNPTAFKQCHIQTELNFN